MQTPYARAIACPVSASNSVYMPAPPVPHGIRGNSGILVAYTIGTHFDIWGRGVVL